MAWVTGRQPHRIDKSCPAGAGIEQYRGMEVINERRQLVQANQGKRQEGSMSRVRGIRGATNIPVDTAEELIEATTELLLRMQQLNSFEVDEIASILFTVTPDIRSAFPAEAARLMGWTMVPLLCFQEIEISGSMEHCIRVLLHWNTDKSQQEIKHVYLRDAVQLRRDLCEE